MVKQVASGAHGSSTAARPGGPRAAAPMGRRSVHSGCRTKGCPRPPCQSRRTSRGRDGPSGLRAAQGTAPASPERAASGRRVIGSGASASSCRCTMARSSMISFCPCTLARRSLPSCGPLAAICAQLQRRKASAASAQKKVRRETETESTRNGVRHTTSRCIGARINCQTGMNIHTYSLCLL